VMTVSDSIALQYETEYGIKPMTIRNCSRESVDIMPFSRKELGLNEDHLLLILQGTGINVDRGGEELIDAIGGVDNVSLLIVGSGNMVTDLKEKVSKMDLSQRVKFYPKLPWELMMRYTKTADVGVSLDKDTNINYRFSLPNKIFDYISAGIPVIAGDLPEVSKIVKELNCGVIIPKISPEVIVKFILEIKENPILLTQLKKNAVMASESINWEQESLKVIEFYQKVFSKL
jgi:glycosyltransferase involved in cell wall biosynthesis